MKLNLKYFSNKLLKRIFYYFMLIFAATFYQFYWVIGNLSDYTDVAFLDSDMSIDIVLLSISSTIFLVILFLSTFFINNIYIKISIEILLIVFTWIYWNYYVFVDRESFLSIFSFTEDYYSVLAMSLFPIFIPAVLTVIIINLAFQKK